MSAPAPSFEGTGHDARPGDWASGFSFDLTQAAFFERHDHSPDRRLNFLRARPGALRFYYRQSPEPLVARGWVSVVPWGGPPELGRVIPGSPPLTVPDMAEVVIDTEGRLVTLTVVPPRYDETPGPFAPPDWTPLLKEAGLDAGSLIAVPSRWAAPVDSDFKAAWDGTYTDRPDSPVHVEAAAYHGRVVSFEVQGPWVRPTSSASAGIRFLGLAQGLMFAVAIPMVVTLFILVRRNLRLGRGDRRGAMRLALGVFLVLGSAQAIRADHTRVALEEYALIVHIVSQGCYAALFLWAFYLALEPAVRRRWPHCLISWTRLLAGRFKDPLVARDLLLGILAGLSLCVAVLVVNEAPRWFGRPPSLSNSVLTALNAPRFVGHYLLMAPLLGVLYALSALLILYMIFAITGRLRLAQILTFLVVAVPALAGAEDPWFDTLLAVYFSGLTLWVLTRFGLLPSASLLATFVLCTRVPLTLEWSAWYAGRSFLVLGILVIVMGSSAYFSLGGRPLFGKAVLDD